MQIKDTNRSRREVIVLCASCFLLQAALSPNVGMGNGRINFALVFAGTFALWKGGRSGVWAGFAAGLVFDLLSTGPIGLMALLLTVFSYVLGLEERDRFADGFVACLSSYGTGALAVTLAYSLTMIMLGDASGVIDLFALRVLPTFALSFVAFLPFAYLRVRAAGGGGLGSRGTAPHGTHYDMRNL